VRVIGTAINAPRDVQEQVKSGSNRSLEMRAAALKFRNHIAK
jgi:hypothetical protein